MVHDPLQETSGCPRSDHRPLEVHDEAEGRGEAAVDGIVDGRIAARLVELGQPSLRDCPLMGRPGRIPNSGQRAIASAPTGTPLTRSTIGS